MRRIIISVSVLIIIAIALGPFVVGLWFQKNYRDVISLYNSESNVHVAILDYQRGWWSSDLTLEIQIDKAYLQKVIADEDIAAKFSKMILKQHVQHGPLILHHSPHLFGLAEIQNHLVISPEMNAFLLLLGMSNAQMQLDSFASFFGNYFNHLTISGFTLSDSQTAIKTGVKNIDANFWIYPRQQRFAGDVSITDFFVSDADDSLEIPDVKIQLDQYLDKHNVWLGSGAMSVSEILFKETDEKDIRIAGINVEGFTKPDQDFVNAERKIKIDSIQFEDQLIGPIDLQIYFNRFYLPAIHDLFVAYKNVIENGELYQGQLRQQITTLLPKVISGGSSIALNQLAIMTPDGNINAKGKFIWPEKDFITPSDLRDLLMSGQANLDILVSKKLMTQLINFASTIPDFIRDVAAPQKNSLMEARNQMDFAMKQNAFFVEDLFDRGYISKKAEEVLIDVQKDFVPMDEYAKTVRDLFLDKQIALVVSYQLCWQYAEIMQPFNFLQGKVKEFQTIAKKQIQDQFTDLLKKGYVVESGDSYKATVKWSANAFTSNGLEVNE